MKTIDRDFAGAWVALGRVASQAGLPLADSAFVEAQRLSTRLTAAQHLALYATMARASGDPGRALQLWDQVIRESPRSAEAFFDRGATLRSLGRFDEALESMRRAIELSPLGPRPLHLNGLAVTLAGIGRTADAHRYARQLNGPLRLNADLLIALAEDKWELADSLARAVEADPIVIAIDRWHATLARASCDAARGRLAAARRALLRADGVETPAGSRTVQVEAQLQLMALASDHATLAPGNVIGVRFTGVVGRFIRGIVGCVEWGYRSRAPRAHPTRNALRVCQRHA